MKIIEDLRAVSVISEGISWGRISMNIAACLEVKGEAARFSRLMGVSTKVISEWQHFEKVPSFQKVLEICYAAGISPLQLMSDAAGTRNVIQAISEHPRRRPAHHRLQVVNREEIREYLQAVLDGRKPARPIRQIERELGVGFRTINRIFPLECSLVSKQYLAQRSQARRQHIVELCDEIRQIILDLYAQGIYPSERRVRHLLSEPNMFPNLECRAAFRTIRRELGLEG